MSTPSNPAPASVAASSKRPEALAILGPTASGKTALALELARHCPIEIVSIDSALVYREMDIGTAKPSADELAQVAHHLIDIRDPDTSYSAADFASDAVALFAQIRQRGRVPVLVGGTMMYHKALTLGLDDLPPADMQIRQRLEAQALEHGWPFLHQRLAVVDPVTAQRLAPQDAQRIQRALEVYELTGQPMSNLHRRSQAESPALALEVISLEPAHRADLHARIAQRFALMLNAGLVGEVEQLRQRWTLNAAMPSMRCVGYRQVWEMLEGQLPMAELQDQGIFATRQLAKRQLTWLRSLAGKRMFDPFSASGVKDALEACRRFCDGYR